jgi:Holliday junction resolvase
MIRAAKVDANQPEIVALFRKLGWSVLIISQLKNCCDIIVSKNGRTIAVEIKDGAKPLSKQKLTEGEAKFKSEWQGEYAIVTCENEVLKLV